MGGASLPRYVCEGHPACGRGIPAPICVRRASLPPICVGEASNLWEGHPCPDTWGASPAFPLSRLLRLATTPAWTVSLILRSTIIDSHFFSSLVLLCSNSLNMTGILDESTGILITSVGPIQQLTDTQIRTSLKGTTQSLKAR